MAITDLSRPTTSQEKKVIFASSLGTVFEWYDFYLLIFLTTIIGNNFFPATMDAATKTIFVLLLFAAGFIIRPFGALVFGRLGDMIGRKHTFLITILIMGLSTFLVGVLPAFVDTSYSSGIGIAAPIIFVSLRLLQGLALGGEYGGAATYVAENSPRGKLGLYTSWIQTTATMGLFLALLVIMLVRINLTKEAYIDWGWRVPFLVSIFLLAISAHIRLSMNESPAFQKMKSEGKISKAPLSESFGQWGNLKIVILALFGLTAGQAVVWYGGQFYSRIFMIGSLQIDETTVDLMLATALLIGAPFFIVFGALSDKIGRKIIIMAGCLLAALTYRPVFEQLTEATNPALYTAQKANKVVVTADPAECSFQFNPTGTAKFTSSCDVAKQKLSERSVSYDNEITGPGTKATIKVGETVINVAVTSDEVQATKEATLKKIEDLKAATPQDEKAIKDEDAMLKTFGDDSKNKEAVLNANIATALKKANYPAKADLEKIDKVKTVLLLTYLVILVTMVYGPVAAMLVELFPTRIRYTSVSLPYHIGNGWFGGLLPATSVAIVAQTGNMYSGLLYPIIIASMTFVVGMLFVKETKDVDIYAND
ncbi:MAG: MFS transporter [Limnohabitans sp.]|nr:MFS transporter [Limnohabitans sp.]